MIYAISFLLVPLKYFFYLNLSLISLVLISLVFISSLVILLMTYLLTYFSVLHCKKNQVLSENYGHKSLQTINLTLNHNTMQCVIQNTNKK